MPPRPAALPRPPFSVRAVAQTPLSSDVALAVNAKRSFFRMAAKAAPTSAKRAGSAALAPDSAVQGPEAKKARADPDANAAPAPQPKTFAEMPDAVRAFAQYVADTAVYTCEQSKYEGTCHECGTTADVVNAVAEDGTTHPVCRYWCNYQEKRPDADTRRYKALPCWLVFEREDWHVYRGKALGAFTDDDCAAALEKIIGLYSKKEYANSFNMNEFSTSCLPLAGVDAKDPAISAAGHLDNITGVQYLMPTVALALEGTEVMENTTELLQEFVNTPLKQLQGDADDLAEEWEQIAAVAAVTARALRCAAADVRRIVDPEAEDAEDE